jgi:hypothetical protein
VASNRLLKLMDKGVTVEQVARAAAAFQDAGTLVHSYLMYGFPTQTEQETIDSMELVRQLFAEGLINSAFWHRFVATQHAPVFQDPARFKLTIIPNPPNAFANNDLKHEDPTGANHDLFDAALPMALDSWMNGKELDRPVHSWFDHPMPKTQEAPDRISNSLNGESQNGTQLLWIGGKSTETQKSIVLHTTDGSWEIEAGPQIRQWIKDTLRLSSPDQSPYGLSQAQKSFPGKWDQFTQDWEFMREAGLLLL